jgi:hypothetical protein
MSIVERSLKGRSSVREEQTFSEIVALLSEILVLDFQQHKAITVGSPPLGSRKDNSNTR